MKLPDVKPLKENIVVTSPGELLREIQEALSGASSVFIKALGKKGSSRYYITVLFDSSKVLAAEGQEIESGAVVKGNDAIELLRGMAAAPMVIDVYSLDEISTKLSIADNLDIYSETPKVPLDELFGGGPPAKPSAPPVQKAKPAPKPQPQHKHPEEKTPPVEKKVKETEETRKPTEEKPKLSSKPGEVEITIEIPGGENLEGALKEYAKLLIQEARRIRTLQLNRIEFSGELSGGVLYLNVHLCGHSEGQMREVAEKRMLHAISKHAPVILREADVKPILRDIRVSLDGKELKPQEIVEKDKKKTGKVGKDGKITLSVLEDVWTYFSAMTKTAVGEMRDAGIKVDAANFDVKGRREFEINVKLAVETSLTEDEAQRAIRDILNHHAKELGKTLDRYITVHTVDVEFVRKPAAVVTPSGSKVTSSKAAEILQKKADLEKEVEKLLRQAGVDELSFLTEEKKKESEQALLKSRIEPAMEVLKSRLHTELKLIPRVTFKWLKLNWDVKDSTVYVDIEASFLKEEVGGLFGSFSGVDEDKLKRDARETILRVIRDVSREYSITLKLQKLNVIVR
ncbi:DUF2226 domain-containing protein [Thermococcus sp. Bubb.Bath]|uniref:DUF2226 domain-containing protein n=1 Tax=Thermococcus sp. Bubb.Bath TaxID=1638242 RepID=UPI00143C88BF|nr:DUF2226 domain-containing protein [Thermococcus sp. Bubb.Bath]NJF25636.1 DUF2226 domain-containing protein [Thermococcus sp. Bubb.Bath]